MDPQNVLLFTSDGRCGYKPKHIKIVGVDECGNSVEQDAIVMCAVWWRVGLNWLSWWGWRKWHRHNFRTVSSISQITPEAAE